MYSFNLCIGKIWNFDYLFLLDDWEMSICKKSIIDTNLIGWFCRVSIGIGEKNNNRIDLIFVVYTERVRKRWSTNDVPFHFTTVCCVSSQTEITHGNVAVLFSFSLCIYRDPRINQLYMGDWLKRCLYENTMVAWNAEWTDRRISVSLFF